MRNTHRKTFTDRDTARERFTYRNGEQDMGGRSEEKKKEGIGAEEEKESEADSEKRAKEREMEKER